MKLSTIISELKQLAVELDICILVINGLNRATENRKNHRPIMTDIKRVKDIERFFDIILFIYREKYYDPYTDNNSEVIITKNSHRITGTVNFIWDSKLLSFRENVYT